MTDAEEKDFEIWGGWELIIPFLGMMGAIIFAFSVGYMFG